MLRRGNYTSFLNVIQELRRADSNPNYPIIFNKYFMQKGMFRVDYQLDILNNDIICYIENISFMNNFPDYIHSENINNLILSGYTSKEIYLYACNNIIIDDNFILEEWEPNMKHNSEILI